MAREIRIFPSSQFYGGLLTDGEKIRLRTPPPVIRSLQGHQDAIHFYDMGFSKHGGKQSLTNREEAR